MTEYLILLTYGSYSDYGVEGLYKADHSVSQDEFDILCKKFKEKEKEILAPVEYLNRINTYSEYLKTPERMESIKHRKENNPVKVFVEKHGLIPVEYAEIWRDI